LGQVAKTLYVQYDEDGDEYDEDEIDAGKLATGRERSDD